MAIRIIQDKTTKKRKSVKKTAGKKSKSGYTTRHTDLAMPYRTINIMHGGTRKKEIIIEKTFPYNVYADFYYAPQPATDLMEIQNVHCLEELILS